MQTFFLNRMNHDKKKYFNNNYDQLLYRHRQYILINDLVDVDVVVGWVGHGRCFFKPCRDFSNKKNCVHAAYLLITKTMVCE